jgi:hypothetical protein
MLPLTSKQNKTSVKNKISALKSKTPVALSIFVIMLFAASVIQAQKLPTKNQASSDSTVSQSIRSTPAYAEILLRKTELEAELEDFLVAYTEDYPKVKEARYELGLVNSSLNKLLAVKASESGKLTLALGKLLVRKAKLETDLWSLKTKYGDEHPDVKRAARKVTVFEKAVKEILP